MSTAPVMIRALTQQLESARQLTDSIFRILNPSAFYLRPIPERHRLIFYLGHLEAFDWNLMCRKTLGVPSLHPQFDKLFEFGIDPPVGQAAADQPWDWPGVEETQIYNRKVRGAINRSLAQVPEQIIRVALEHRLMHAETLSYLLHHLPYEEKSPADAVPIPAGLVRSKIRWIEIPPGVATLGQKPGEFGWDNEFDEHQVNVSGFHVSKYKVTNGQYLDFVRDGAPPPNFWVRQGKNWVYRGMFAEAKLPLNAPVYVTHAEAEAFARWVGKRLPTEEQFHRAAYGTLFFEGSERLYPWGDAAPDPSRGNFDFYQWDPVDVNANPAGDSAAGVAQLVGNGWEWTSTRFAPFPGFQPLPFYPGYSKDFFDEEHYVMKGGSPVTAAPLLRRSFRNWFRPNYPYVYASFRLVED
jgi:iron(II)-dependent oxidoreductase